MLLLLLLLLLLLTFYAAAAAVAAVVVAVVIAVVVVLLHVFNQVRGSSAAQTPSGMHFHSYCHAPCGDTGGRYSKRSR